MTWSFLEILKTELSYDPAIPILAYIQRYEIGNLKRYLHFQFIATLFQYLPVMIWICVVPMLAMREGVEVKDWVMRALICELIPL